MVKILEKLAGVIESKESENMVKHLENESNVKTWENNPLLQKWLKTQHTAGQDITAGIEELSMQVLTARRPAHIGRMLVRRFDTTNDRIKVRAPKIGKTAKTQKGKISIQSHGERQSFINLEPDTEIEVSDEWDINFVENAEWNVMSTQTAEIGTTLSQFESKYIVDKLVSVSTAQTAGLTVKANNDPLTPDHLIDAWGRVLTQDGDANSVVMNPASCVELLKSSDFKSQLLLGQFANYSTGMLGMFLGMQIYMSTQVPENTTLVFDKNRFLYAVWRRDRLVVPYSPRVNVTGIQASTRLGLQFADTKVCSPIRAS